MDDLTRVRIAPSVGHGPVVVDAMTQDRDGAAGGRSVIELRAHQQAAVDVVVQHLADGGRGQIHAATGSGKTITVIAAADMVIPGDRVIAMVVPSLTLAAQTIAAWKQHGAPHSVFAACSDGSVIDESVRVSDLRCATGTDVDDIAAWIQTTPGRLLLVCTYNSAGRVGAALLTIGVSADMLIVDEAHRTSGRVDKRDALVHDDAAFPAQRRLYITATPRYVAEGIGRSPGSDDVEPLGMDDEDVYGPVLSLYPFRQGIADGYLDDYRIAVVGVTDTEVRNTLRMVGRTDLTDTESAPLHTAMVQTVAAQAARLLRLRRILVFTPSVASAAEFARTMPSTIAALDDAPSGLLTSRHVHGRMPTWQRRDHLEELAHPPGGGWTVLANCRCLGEGIDVPAVDAVVFTAPKSSPVDIVQSVGRALRHNPDGDGVSTILLPVLLPDNPEEEIDPGQFHALWRVLAAIRAHDDDLAAELDLRLHVIRELKEVSLPRQFLVHLPAGWDRDSTFLRRLTVRFVAGPDTAWWDMLAQARSYAAEHGHTRVPLPYRTPDGDNLGRWIAAQRVARRDGSLSADRIAALDDLDMSWNPQKWDTQLAAAAAFAAREGHLRPSIRHVENGAALGAWIVQNRSRRQKGTINPNLEAALTDLGMVWDLRESAWNDNVAAYRSFLDREGEHPPTGHPLSTWRLDVRSRWSKLTDKRRRDATDLGITPGVHQAKWDRALSAARAFKEREGHLRPSRNTVEDGVRLGAWVFKLRQERRNGVLNPERVAQLDVLGMDWDPNGLSTDTPGSADALRRGLCPICGEGPFQAVAKHVAKKHGIPADQLKAAAGIPKSHGLNDSGTTERQRQARVEMGAHPNLIAAGRTSSRAATTSGAGRRERSSGAGGRARRKIPLDRLAELETRHQAGERLVDLAAEFGAGASAMSMALKAWRESGTTRSA